MDRHVLVVVMALAVTAVAGAAAGEEVLNENEPPEDISVEFAWDDDKLFLNMEAGDCRIKFDSETGEYEVYVPRDPDSDEPYFRENDLLVSIDEAADRIVVIAKGDKDTIRESLDDIIEGDLGELEPGETDGITIRELDDGYEIIVEGKNGSAEKDDEDDD
jgi:hypothetical protein